MDLHLVGGFLGSGKTTAIIAAAKQLMAAGQNVGVVTNDQGKYQVDTAFMRLNQIPAVQVSGGCFCCHYDDLEARLAELRADQHPDVVFAESVGSCGDLVATVVKPLLALRGGEFAPSSFSVFCDSRLLQMRLQDEEMPFSEAVLYIFDKQIEEADRVVINKADLLAPDEAAALLSAAQAAYPGKHIRLQDSTHPADVAGWLGWLTQPPTHAPQAVEMDYARYAAGEAELGWLDLIAQLELPAVEPRPALMAIVAALLETLEVTGWIIGHCKLVVSGPGWFARVSLPTLFTSRWEDDFPTPSGRSVELLLNVRAAADAAQMHARLRAALLAAAQRRGVGVTSLAADHFHPAPPIPRHRMA